MLWIPHHQRRQAQTGHIEGFTGRYGGNQGLFLIGQFRQYMMGRLVRIGEVAMNLIRQHHQVVAPGNGQYLPELAFAPHPSHRVMGRAQQQHPGVVPCCTGFQVLKIHLIAAIHLFQRVFNHRTTGFPNGTEERRVNRRLYYHPFTFASKRQCRRVQRRHHPRGHH